MATFSLVRSLRLTPAFLAAFTAMVHARTLENEPPGSNTPGKARAEIVIKPEGGKSGKIWLPADVIEKDGTIKPAEVNICATHPTVDESIEEKINQLADVYSTDPDMTNEDLELHYTALKEREGLKNWILQNEQLYKDSGHNIEDPAIRRAMQVYALAFIRFHEAIFEQTGIEDPKAFCDTGEGLPLSKPGHAPR